jgi:predicted TIM-barrel fold metal-dependent hydrolase
MAISPTRVAAADVRELWDGPIIDVDVHVHGGLGDLRRYLDDVWLEFMEERGLGPWTGAGPSRMFAPELAGLSRVYPPGAQSTVWERWKSEDGRAPGSDISLLREHVLDHLGVEFAILNSYMALDSMRYPDFHIALVQANNDWLIEEWLSKDSRLRASMILPSRSPTAAVAEVERVGNHPGFVQALVPVHSHMLYGKRDWHPLMDALVRHDLVFGLHIGGTSEGPSTVTGTPNHYITEYVSETSLFGGQLLSLIGEGTFAEFPKLRVSMLEAGFAWMPAMSWRFDKEWKGLRRDVPWVLAPPTELIRQHVRFATSPLDINTAQDMESMVRWLLSDELLMFSTDYPHWHDDDVNILMDALPRQAQAKMMAENARAWYRL